MSSVSSATSSDEKNHLEEKVGLSVRVLARLVDLCFILFLDALMPSIVGPVFGIIYTLTQDTWFGGQSIGKKLFKLKVVKIGTNELCDIQSSSLRNIPFAIAVFFTLIPLWGWVLFGMLLLPLSVLELYLIFTRHDGHRLGDILADTAVVHYQKSEKAL